MDGRAWWATVHGVAKSRTQLSDFTSLHFTSLHFTISVIGMLSKRNERLNYQSGYSVKASNTQKIALGLLMDLAETGLIMGPQVTDRRCLLSDPPSHWVGRAQQ